MPSRTWLTTPSGEQPVTDQRGDEDEERYVAALELPREPRVPGRFRRLWVAVGLVAAVVLAVLALLLLGEQTQQEDPSVPDVPSVEDPAPDEAEGGTLPQ